MTSAQWGPALTQRVRVLLYALPFHDVHGNDTRRREELRHYPGLPIAMRILDLIVENTGLEDEMDRTRIQNALRPLLTRIDTENGKAPDEKRQRLIVDTILGILMNEADHRRPFDLAYSDFDENGAPVKRSLSFRLVTEEHHPAGGFVLRLTKEALNIYLNALDHDIESLQAATQAMIEDQLRRGKFDDAARTAQNARLLSIRYKQQIRRIIQDTRRDIARVDWAVDIPRRIEDARVHIEARQLVELNIAVSAREKLNDLPPDDERAGSLARVIRLIRECEQDHAELHGEIMSVRDTFFEEQERQQFAPKPPKFQPNLLEETLFPLLAMNVRDAVVITDASFPAFLGVRADPLLSLAQLIGSQLQPKPRGVRGQVPVEELDLTTASTDLAAFTLEERAQANEILRNAPKPIELSELLVNAEAAGAPKPVRDLVALLAFRHYAPERDSPAAFRAERKLGHRIHAPGYYGDELTLHEGGPSP